MFEDLFEFSNKPISEGESSDFPTFEDYLTNKKKDNVLSEKFVDTRVELESNSGMITFLEYLESKNIVIVEDSEDDIEEPLIETPSNFKNDPEIKVEKTTIKSLWDGYVQQVKNYSKKGSYVNIQDASYLAESRAKYAEALIEDQKRVHDNLYFFSGGGHVIEDEEEFAVIGKAIIGKNKIY